MGVMGIVKIGAVEKFPFADFIAQHCRFFRVFIIISFQSPLQFPL